MATVDVKQLTAGVNLMQVIIEGLGADARGEMIEGALYSQLMQVMDLPAFNKMIGILVDHGIVTKRGHVIRLSDDLQAVFNAKREAVAATVAQFGPVVHLECCCCGSGTYGRQWWNRDTGYGLCPGCFEMNGVADVAHGQEARSFGVRGVHWDVPSPR